VVDLWDLFWAVRSRSWHCKSFFADPPDLLQSARCELRRSSAQGRDGDGPPSWLASWARRYAMAIGSSGSFGLVAAGGASPGRDAEDDRAGAGSGTPRVRSAMRMRSARRRPPSRRLVGRRCGWWRFRLFDDKPGAHHSLEGEHVHALRSRERGCFFSCRLYGRKKIQSTTDAGSLNTFGRNEIEVAPISSALLRIACLVILYKLVFRTKNSQPMGYQDRYEVSRSTT
jgi:hypothetical protein